MESIYSNFDHEFEDGAENWCKANPGQMLQHSAWDFCGKIYWDKDTKEFVEEIWIVRSHENTLRHKDIKQLILAVNDQYGSN